MKRIVVLSFALVLLFGFLVPLPTTYAAGDLTGANLSDIQFASGFCGGGGARIMSFTLNTTGTGNMDVTITVNGIPLTVTGIPIGGAQPINVNAGGTYAGAFPLPEGSVVSVNITVAGQTSGTENFSFSVPCSTGAGALNTAGDADNDGIENAVDNCPFVANSGQEDGWGSPAGDACDQASIYDNGAGTKIFQQKDGFFHVFGACYAFGRNTRCPLIAIVDITQLNPSIDGLRFESGDSQGWYVLVFYVGTEADGTQVYQINIYNPGGQLQSDEYKILLKDGSVSWRAGDQSGGQTVDFGLSTGGTAPSTPGAVSTGGQASAPDTTTPEQPAPTGFTANPNVRPGDTAIALGGVIIRVDPSLTAAPTGQQILWGELVTVLEEDPTGFWFLVVNQDGTKQGWVANEWFDAAP